MKKLLIILIFTLITFSQINAQWVPTSGPFGGDVRAITKSGINLFAGIVNKGLYFSSDNGATWIPTQLINKNVMVLTISGSTVFAGADGVYLSADNGTTWTSASKGLPEAATVNAFTTIGTTLFAGTSAGVYRTSDNGTTWTSVNNGLTNTNIVSLASDGISLYAGVNGAVYLSANNGESWTSISNGLPSNVVHAIAVSGSNLFAGTSQGVYLSSDSGISWKQMNTGLINTRINTLLLNGTNLYAGTAGGAFISKDNGTSWTAINTGLNETYVNTFLSYGTDIYTGTSGGVYQLYNNGTGWNATGLATCEVFALAAKAGSVYAGTTSGIFVSANNGEIWSAAGLMNKSISSLIVSGSNIFAGTDGSGVFLSSDDGKNWKAANTGIENIKITSVAIKDSFIFAASMSHYFLNNGVYRSSDNGKSWILLNNGLPEYPEVSALTVVGNYLYAGTDGQGVYGSEDNGQSWNTLNNGFQNHGNYYVINTFAIIGTTLLAGTDAGVVRSTNNGVNWSPSGIAETVVGSFASSGNNIFASGRSINLSIDEGITWKSVNTGLALGLSLSNTLVISGQFIFTGSYMNQGVWRRPLSEMITSVEGEPTVAPDQFSLGQNYPNPFNPTTTIEYTAPGAGHVNINIFDINGRLVKTIGADNGRAGTYRLEWNGMDERGVRVSSGIYIYQLDSGKIRDSRKMIMLK